MSFAKVESLRLRYIADHQQELRAEAYQTLRDAFSADDHDLSTLGRRVILPPSFQGSPRDMQRRYQDAMAIVRKCGKPDLFITVTCNPQWPEIRSALLPGQEPHDRPDLVARVFKAYLTALMEDVVKKKVFGQVLAYLYVIEFQKRGLPHAHILVILSESPQNAADVDQIVRAELPIDTRLRDIVSKQMFHGPCGVLNPRSPCMSNGVCSKKYPKPFSPESSWDEETTHPTYRRRSPAENGLACTVRNKVVDNRWVVPYNPFLIAKYRCHINVEICSSVRACKYLFKYVYKGPDRSMVGVSSGQGHDEVRNYQDMRTIGSSEACWRLFSFDMSERSPAVVALPVHVENGQTTFFSTEHEAIHAAQQPPKTQLTAWFQYNTENATQSDELPLYADMPQWCTWHKPTKTWKRKRRMNGTIGRIHWIHPAAGDIFYLRMLLHHPHSKGKLGFSDLRTIDSTTYSTYQSTCRALGLLQDDSEWCAVMDDAVHSMMPRQLRQLFVALLKFNTPSDPQTLFNRYYRSMAEDYERVVERCQMPEQTELDEVLRALVLIDVQKRLSRVGKDTQDFGLQSISEEFRSLIAQLHSDFRLSELPSVLREEMSYDRDSQQSIADDAFQKMLPSQRAVVDPVLEGVLHGRQVLAFWDAPAGTGKTFCMNALLAAVRAKGLITLPVATSGIAAVLMAGGRTFHSRFKAPLRMFAETIFPISRREALAQLLREAKIICWDEAPMAHRYLLEALDRTLRDIMGNDLPFGGKSIVLAGDFRQVLPVLKRGTRAQIVNACLKRSALWGLFHLFHLTENMRIRRFGISQAAGRYGDWLIKLGNGNFPEIAVQNDDTVIEIPEGCRVQSSVLQDLINWTFPSLQSENLQTSESLDGAILCTRNNIVDDVNRAVSDKFPGECIIVHSADAIEDDPDSNVNVPEEYLNTLTSSGLPPHNLVLKKGMPLMLLRNLDPHGGLCNGTRMILESIVNRRLLQAKICGTQEIVFIPRLKMAPKDGDFPFRWHRTQFPIRVAFAMTINKSQGQTMGKAGVYLPEPVFSHGQLYVAASRVCHPDSIRFCLPHGEAGTRNVVYTEALR